MSGQTPMGNENGINSGFRWQAATLTDPYDGSQALDSKSNHKPWGGRNTLPSDEQSLALTPPCVASFCSSLDALHTHRAALLVMATSEGIALRTSNVETYESSVCLEGVAQKAGDTKRERESNEKKRDREIDRREKAKRSEQSGWTFRKKNATKFGFAQLVS